MVEPREDQDLVAREDFQPEPVRPQEVAPQLPQTPEAMQDFLIRWRKAMFNVSLAATRYSDWQHMGDTPYLKDSGVKALCSVFAISSQPLKEEIEIDSDEYGEFRTYTVHVRAWLTHPLTRQLMEATRKGSASSKDPFFNRKDERLPISEIDLQKVKKKAETNAASRAVKSVLGFNPTWEEIQASLGESSQKVGAVEYKGKSAQKSTGKGTLTKEKQEARRMILEMCYGDEDMARNMLESYSEFPGRDGETVPGVRNVAELTDRRAQVVYGKVKKEYERFLQEQAAAPTRQPGEEG